MERSNEFVGSPTGKEECTVVKEGEGQEEMNNQMDALNKEFIKDSTWMIDSLIITDISKGAYPDSIEHGSLIRYNIPLVKDIGIQTPFNQRLRQRSEHPGRLAFGYIWKYAMGISQPYNIARSGVHQRRRGQCPATTGSFEADSTSAQNENNTVTGLQNQVESGQSTLTSEEPLEREIPQSALPQLTENNRDELDRILIRNLQNTYAQEFQNNTISNSQSNTSTCTDIIHHHGEMWLQPSSSIYETHSCHGGNPVDVPQQGAMERTRNTRVERRIKRVVRVDIQQ